MTIEIRIELDDHWQVYTDREGRRYATTLVEEDDVEWITANLFKMGKEGYGTHHHNSASIIIKMMKMKKRFRLEFQSETQEVAL